MSNASKGVMVFAFVLLMLFNRGILAGDLWVNFPTLPARVGAGLQAEFKQVSLDTFAHGGVVVHIESSDPTRVLVAPDGATAGTSAIDIAIPDGYSQAYFSIQGVEGMSGAATLTASAKGFNSGTGTVFVVPAMLQLEGFLDDLTPLMPDRPFNVRVGIEDEWNPQFFYHQSVRAGSTLTATVTNANADVAQLTTLAGPGQVRTVSIVGGTSASPDTVAAGGVVFDALNTGDTTVSATIPGVITRPSGTVPIQVVSAMISFPTLPARVGAGLQVENQYALLDSSAHGGVVVHIQSSDPARALVAPDAATPGTPAIDVVVPNGAVYVPFSIQGVDGESGDVTLIASANGFSSASGKVEVVQPALQIVDLSPISTPFTPDDAFEVQVGILISGEALASQNVRAGSSLTATLTNSNAGVARLTTLAGAAQVRTVTIAEGRSYSPNYVTEGGIAFDSLNIGDTTISASIPGFITVSGGTVAVHVTAAAISFNTLPSEVGAGLQENNHYVSVDSSAHGGILIHIQSGDPTRALLTVNPTRPGTSAIDVFLADGQTYGYFSIQGVDGQMGAVTITASTIGFESASGTIYVVQPALWMENLPALATPLSADIPFNLRVGIQAIKDSNLVEPQEVRAGSSLTATVTNGNAAVAQLTTLDGTAQVRTVTIAEGQSTSPSSVAEGGIAFDSLDIGDTTVSAAIPGFITTKAGTITVHVTEATISLPTLPSSVGAGLQASRHYAHLETLGFGSVIVHLESSDPSRALVGPAGNAPGMPAVDIPLQDGDSLAFFSIHGVDGASGDVTVTASASGFGSASGTVHIVQPALQIEELPKTPSPLDPDHLFYVRVGIPAPGNAGLLDGQNVRAGSKLTATVTNSNAMVAQLTTLTGSSQMHSVTIDGGSSTSPTTVDGGGIAFDPLDIGDTTVSATIPGFITTMAGTVTLHVGSGAISIPTFPTSLGAGLQAEGPWIYLDRPYHGGVVVHIESDDPTLVLIAPNGNTLGTPSIDVAVPNGESYVPFSIQGIEGTSGKVTVTASANGFSPGSGIVEVVPAALDIWYLPPSSTPMTPDIPFYVQVGIPSPENSRVNSPQDVRVGSNLTATVTNANALVAQLTTLGGSAQSRTVTIAGGRSSSPLSVAEGGVAFDSLGVGETTVSATIPGLVTTAAGVIHIVIPDDDEVPSDDGDSTNDPCTGGVTSGCDDNCPFSGNPAQEDKDADGVGDVCDNCAEQYNPGQADADNDGVGSTCDCNPVDPANQIAQQVGNSVRVEKSAEAVEISWFDGGLPGPFNVYRGWRRAGTPASYDQYCVKQATASSSEVDALPTPAGTLFYYLVSRAAPPCAESNLGKNDQDVVIPNVDPCPSSAIDADGDGVEEAIDTCPGSPDPAQLDSDGDTHGNSCDNCAQLANPQQEDLDADELGDACDPDVDGDGVDDDADESGTAGDNRCSGGATLLCDDNCATVPNADQFDRDQDAVGDLCDNCADVFNPTQADWDYDTEGDACDPDDDADGVLDVDDACPYSDFRPTVFFGDCDTCTRNRLLGRGCTLADMLKLALEQSVGPKDVLGSITVEVESLPLNQAELETLLQAVQACMEKR